MLDVHWLIVKNCWAIFGLESVKRGKIAFAYHYSLKLFFFDEVKNMKIIQIELIRKNVEKFSLEEYVWK